MAKRYFRLLWKPTLKTGQKINWGGMEMDVIAPITDQLAIYGYEQRSKHPGDKRIMDEKYEKGFIYGYWFSNHCLDGELGFYHLSRLTEIKEQEFKAWKRMVTP